MTFGFAIKTKIGAKIFAVLPRLIISWLVPDDAGGTGSRITRDFSFIDGHPLGRSEKTK